MNEIVKMEAVRQLEAAVKKATEAADRLLKCAESISNPQYVVTMEGQQLEILAAAHTAGVITLRVKSPFSTLETQRRLEEAHPMRIINYTSLKDDV